MATSDKSSGSQKKAGKLNSISYQDTENMVGDDEDEEEKGLNIQSLPRRKDFRPKFFPESSPIELENIILEPEPERTFEEVVQYLEDRIRESKDVGSLQREEDEKLHDYLFKIPPDFEEAKRHGKAMKVRVSQEDARGDRAKQCTDCKRVLPEYTRKLGMWESTDHLIEHGDGFPLLFQFLGFLILLFSILFVFQGIFFYIALLVEIDGQEFSVVNLFSVDVVVDKGPDGKHTAPDGLITVYIVLTFVTNLIIIAIVWIFWVKQYKLTDKLDLQNLTDADFAVMAYNLPEDLLGSDLRQHIVGTAGIENDDIIYLNKCYKYDQILKLKKQQFKWLQLKTDLEIFRNKLVEKGELSEDRYPKSVGFNFWK